MSREFRVERGLYSGVGLFALAIAAVARTAAGVDPDRPHWAFQKLSRPAMPVVEDLSGARTPVDAFILASLDAQGLSFSPEAGRVTFIRRLSLDLSGLPPPPEAVEQFTADPSPDAYERLVDRLLASPHFGERWGRHWLDGAGYADVHGGDNDAGIIKLSENKWLYRDWVVEAFNSDSPFARFLTEQLAGDELVDWRAAPTFTPEIQGLLIATGFLRTAADDTNENELNTLDIRHGVLQRTAEVLATNVLGLTLQCAKCHDHKYEPIPQRDYYRFLAFLQPAFNPDHWLQPQARQLAAVSPAEKAEIERQSAQNTQNDANAGKPDASRPKPGWSHWQVVYDVGPPTPTRLLARGSHLAPREEVEPGFLSVLSESEAARIAGPCGAAGVTSGRRLALARWLTDAGSPAGALVLRVRVNRVWQHLFGGGIVATPDNFGVTGAAPTHRELLEWLASELAAGGGHLKPLVRLLVTSAAHRQASVETHGAEGIDPRVVDPDDRLLWRMRLRRLESEGVRDALLAVSGRLDSRLGGPPVPVEPRPDGTFAASEKGLPPGASPHRRSLYLLARRNYHPTLLGAFDQPVLTTNCACRTPSAVVLQSLAMLNDPFVLEQAAGLAAQVLASAGPSLEARIAAAFRRALGRPPTPAESGWSREFLESAAGRSESEALRDFCHALVNTSEFLYIP